MNSSLAEKLSDVQRSSANQMARCQTLLKRLKVIQLQELEEYGERQMECAIKLLAETKGVKLKEAIVPDFLQKRKLPIPPADAFEEEDFIEKADPSPPPVYTKHGLADLRDVSLMFRQTIRELLLSTIPLGTDDVDTDSGSEYEDEVQATASTNNCTNWRDDDLVYLPTTKNPRIPWARKRNSLHARYAWLLGTVKTIDQRVVQHTRLLKYIKDYKPSFKFDERRKVTKPVIIGGNLDYSTIQLYREQRNTDILPHEMKNVVDPISGNVVKRTNNLMKTIDNPERSERNFVPLRLRITESCDPNCTARRCIPLCRPIRRRKVLQIGGIHNVVEKPGHLPSALCNCFGREELCIICSGRSDKIKRVRNGAMARSETTALLDHNYHKVLSALEDRPLRLLTEAALKISSSANQKKILPAYDSSDEEGKRAFAGNFLPTAPIRPQNDIVPEESPEAIEPRRPSPVKKVGKAERKSTRKKKRISDDEDQLAEEHEMNWVPKKSSKPADSSHKKRRIADEKYDIDHIVIPYSIASTTRVEKIEYKEIDLPSWRTNQMELTKNHEPPKKGYRKTRTRATPAPVVDKLIEPIEDMRLESILARHARSEEEEKKRFLKAMNVLSNRRSRKSETKGESTDLSQDISPPLKVEIPDNIFIKEEVVSPTLPTTTVNQISAADASLAVTALKISVPNAQSSAASSGRRRTISICKVEEEDPEEPGVAPYEPRKFPLSDEEFAEMVKEMNESYLEEQAKLERREAEVEFNMAQPKIEGIDEESDDGGSEVDDPDWREVSEHSAVS